MQLGKIVNGNDKNMKKIFLKNNNFTNKKIKCFTISDIISKILAVEHEIKSIIYPKKHEIRSFRIKRNYLMNEHFINKEILLRFLGRGCYLFFGGKVKGLLYTRILGERLSCPCIADVIKVGNNLRCFYLSVKKPFCTKVLIGGDRCKEDMENEIKVRLKIAQLELLNIPKIFEVCLDKDPPFFVEEFLRGTIVNGKRNRELIINVINQFWKVYKIFGVYFLKVTEIIPHNSVEKFIGIINKLNFLDFLNNNQLIKKIESLVKNKKLIPCSLCHGDFSTANMLVFNNQIYVFDWENAREMPIAFDLAQVADKVEGVTDIFEYQNNKLGSMYGFQVLTFREQLALKAISEVLSYNSTRKSFEFMGANPKKIQNYFFDQLIKLSSLLM